MQRKTMKIVPDYAIVQRKTRGAPNEKRPPVETAGVC